MTVGTDAFAELIQLEAEQRGLGPLARLIVPHPLGGLKPDAVRALVTPGVIERLRACLVSGRDG